MPDVIVGAGVGHSPEVLAFDGTDGSTVFDHLAYSSSYTGGVRVGAVYLDDDAYADIVAGTGAGVDPRVRTLSGSTGDVIDGPAGDFDPGSGRRPRG